MSERSKGDTSSHSQPTNPLFTSAANVPSRVVKNPLLSAAVTGLTFDDFPNQPLLLPAAPPIVSEPVISHNTIKESKTTVTVGKTPDIDTDTLSEINLNSSVEEENSSDANDNLLEAADDSILSQAASSFSQLPSVATSVFSTFSKKFKDYSPAREDQPGNDFNANLPNLPPQSVQPPFGVGVQPQPLFEPTPFVASAPVPAEPPKFYAPAELPGVANPSASQAHPGSGNTYRLAAKKKYAQIPGLSANFSQTQAAPQAVPANVNLPPLPPALQPQVQEEYQQYQQPFATPQPQPQPQTQPKQEEPKGFFSLSALAPNVLQNISGLVQQATDTITGSKPEQDYNSYQQQPSYQEPPKALTPQSEFAYQQQQSTTLYPNYQPPQPVYEPANPQTQQLEVSYPPAAASPAAAPPLVRPPTGALPSATFRLQKGTKLYKSPFAEPPQPIGGFPHSAPFQPAPNTSTSFFTPTEPAVPFVPTQIPVVGQLTPALPPQPLPPSQVQPPTAISNTPTSFFTPTEPTVPFVPAQIPVAAQLTPAVTPQPPPPSQAQPPKVSANPLTSFFTPTEPTAPFAPAQIPVASQLTPAVTPQPLPPSHVQPPTAFISPSPAPQHFENCVPTNVPQQSVPAPTYLGVVPTPPPVAQVPIANSQFATQPQQVFNLFSVGEPQSTLAPPPTQSLPPTSQFFNSVPAGPPVNFFQPVPEQQVQSFPPIFNNPPVVEETTTSQVLEAESEPAPVVPTESTSQQQFFNPPVQETALEPVSSAHREPTPEPLKTADVPEEKPADINQLEQSASNFFQTTATDQVPFFNTSSAPERVNSTSAQALDSEKAAEAPEPTVPEVVNFFQRDDQQQLFNNPITTEPVQFFNTAQVQETPIATEQGQFFNTPSAPVEEEPALEAPVEFVSESVNPQPSLNSVDLIAEHSPEDSSEIVQEPSENLVEESAAPISQPLNRPDIVPSQAEVQQPIESISEPTNSEQTYTPLGFDLIQSKPTPTPVDIANFLPPPPQTNSSDQGPPSAVSNPYRRGSHSSHLPPPPTLSSIFTPADQSQQTSSVFDFFASQPTATIASPPEQPVRAGAETTQPSSVNFFNPSQPPSSVPASDQSTVQPTLDPIISSDNTLTNFFDNSSSAATPVQEPVQAKLPDPSSFFDFFNQQPAINVSGTSPEASAPAQSLTEDTNSQLIQNFFNNPPPQDINDSRGDLNYNLVGSGLVVKNIETRSATPISNLVEPPSSSCSEISELNSSTASALGAEGSNKASPNENCPPENITEELDSGKMLGGSSNSKFVYSETPKHWFSKRLVDKKPTWCPFSHHDSALLEENFLAGANGQNVVAVEGGRFDVNIQKRQRTSIYWEGETTEVRRCSWFYKSESGKCIPFQEHVSDLLEEGFKQAATLKEWHKGIDIAEGETVLFHAPTDIVNVYQASSQAADSWGRPTQATTRTRIVKRDLDDFTIEEGEPQRVDHLLFMVHGIGSACDLKFRSVEEVVDEFRSISTQLIQSHYKNSATSGNVGRVEVLPISWYEQLHSAELGIDERLKAITLESIPKLRTFTNETLLDILYYTSPIYCQKIVNIVAAAMNSVYMKYCNRNPEFNGGVSISGHSLGSLILFDLLCHQKPADESEVSKELPNQILTPTQLESSETNEAYASTSSYTMGTAGTGQPFISYPQLVFHPKKFFALGSPIGMFVTIRGIDKLGLDFKLPTCPGFYNIFHPYDPVAYRIEALVNPDMSGIRPVLVPHHKGRKRMHLELKETMTRVGADIMQKLSVTFKNLMKKSSSVEEEMQHEVDKVLEMQLQLEQHGSTSPRQRADSTSTTSDSDMIEIDFPLGKLNDSKRIDYVLQEAPLEFINEYIFALSSHLCYWDSADTILFVMKEIYTSLGVSPDSQVPQQTMTIERPTSATGGSQSPPTN